MREQVDCIQNIVLHMQAELDELLGRCNLALNTEAVKTSHNSAMDAIALLKEFIEVYESCGISKELAEYADKVYAVLAQQHQ